MEKFLKNPVLQSKLSLNVDNPSGNLLEEISEQDMSAMAGGTTDAVSKTLAFQYGLGRNYGETCTWSAECAATVRCGD